MRLRIQKKLSVIGHGLLIYFAHPYLSVLGGLGLTFLYSPPSVYSSSYGPLLKAINPYLMGSVCLITSIAALIVIMRIGPKTCGMSLPKAHCMARREALQYLFFCVIHWAILASLGAYFWNMGAATGGSTYWLIGFAYCIRGAFVLIYLLTKRTNGSPHC